MIALNIRDEPNVYAFPIEGLLASYSIGVSSRRKQARMNQEQLRLSFRGPFVRCFVGDVRRYLLVWYPIERVGGDSNRMNNPANEAWAMPACGVCADWGSFLLLCPLPMKES